MTSEANDIWMPGLIPKELQVRTVKLCNTLLEVSGLDAFERRRTREAVTARAFLAMELRREGYTVTEIGFALNKNHSTITHYLAIMETILSSPGYETEREIWNKFKEKYEQTSGKDSQDENQDAGI